MFCRGFRIRQQRVLALCVFLAGALCIPVAVFAPVDDRTRGFFTGAGSALLAVGLVQTFRLWRLARDPEKRREYEVSRSEERTQFILRQSIQMTFYLSLAAEYLGGIIALLAGAHRMGMLFCWLVIGQVILIQALRVVYGKRY